MPLISIPDFCIDTERISICLNNELAEFGFKSTLSPDNIANRNISKSQVDRLSAIADVIKKQEVPVIWKQESITYRTWHESLSSTSS